MEFDVWNLLIIGFVVLLCLVIIFNLQFKTNILSKVNRVRIILSIRVLWWTLLHWLNVLWRREFTSIQGSINTFDIFVIMKERYPGIIHILNDLSKNPTDQNLSKLIEEENWLWSPLLSCLNYCENTYNKNLKLNDKNYINNKISKSNDRLQSEEYIDFDIKVFLYFFGVVRSYVVDFRKLQPEFLDPFHFYIMMKIFGLRSMSLYDFIFDRTSFKGETVPKSELSVSFSNLLEEYGPKIRRDLLSYFEEVKSLNQNSKEGIELLPHLNLPSLEDLFRDH